MNTVLIYNELPDLDSWLEFLKSVDEGNLLLQFPQSSSDLLSTLINVSSLGSVTHVAEEDLQAWLHLVKTFMDLVGPNYDEVPEGNHIGSRWGSLYGVMAPLTFSMRHGWALSESGRVVLSMPENQAA